jgi:hypothetical protein
MIQAKFQKLSNQYVCPGPMWSKLILAILSSPAEPARRFVTRDIQQTKIIT